MNHVNSKAYVVLELNGIYSLILYMKWLKMKQGFSQYLELNTEMQKNSSSVKIVPSCMLCSRAETCE